jgi:hypothetical protein
MTYEQRIEKLREEYKPRMEKILTDLGKAFAEEGFHWDEEVIDMTDDELMLSILLFRPGTEPEDKADLPEDAIDISMTLIEECHRDGGEGGVSFSSDLVEVGGRILGGMCPYNYTEMLWIPADEADLIEKRFRFFEQADPASAVALVLK